MAAESTGKKKIGGAWAAVIIAAVLIAGLAVFFYPSISDRISRYGQSQVITEYAAAAADMPSEENESLLAAAEEYNARLAQDPARFSLTDEEKAEYDSLLNVTKAGVMGYVDIPKIHVSLGIYHGTSEKVLQDAIGHLEGSSLPVGGAGTHAVISGHRGLPTAKLFTDIDQLEEGDRFSIRVLDRVLTYEVDQIKVVLPDELEDLAIDPEKDYCTLLTCTPYAVNTHRLLVRGVRVPDGEKTETQTVVRKAEKVSLLPVILPVAAAAALLLVLLIRAVAVTARRSRSFSGAGNEGCDLQNRSVPDTEQGKR